MITNSYLDSIENSIEEYEELKKNISTQILNSKTYEEIFNIEENNSEKFLGILKGYFSKYCLDNNDQTISNEELEKNTDSLNEWKKNNSNIPELLSLDEIKYLFLGYNWRKDGKYTLLEKDEIINYMKKIFGETLCDKKKIIQRINDYCLDRLIEIKIDNSTEDETKKYFIILRKYEKDKKNKLLLLNDNDIDKNKIYNEIRKINKFLYETENITIDEQKKQLKDKLLSKSKLDKIESINFKNAKKGILYLDLVFDIEPFNIKKKEVLALPQQEVSEIVQNANIAISKLLEEYNSKKIINSNLNEKSEDQQDEILNKNEIVSINDDIQKNKIITKNEKIVSLVEEIRSTLTNELKEMVSEEINEYKNKNIDLKSKKGPEKKIEKQDENETINKEEQKILSTDIKSDIKSDLISESIEMNDINKEEISISDDYKKLHYEIMQLDNKIKQEEYTNKETKKKLDECSEIKHKVISMNNYYKVLSKKDRKRKEEEFKKMFNIDMNEFKENYLNKINYYKENVQRLRNVYDVEIHNIKNDKIEYENLSKKYKKYVKNQFDNNKNFDLDKKELNELLTKDIETIDSYLNDEDEEYINFINKLDEVIKLIENQEQ